MSEPRYTPAEQAARRAEFDEMVEHARARWDAGEAVVIVPYAEWLRRGGDHGSHDTARLPAL